MNKVKIFNRLKNRYVYTSILFFIWLAFIDDFNLIQQYKRSEELNTLIEKEIHFKERIEILKEKISHLDSDPEAIEKYARERYKMKKSNEDIYIFEKPSDAYDLSNE